MPAPGFIAASLLAVSVALATQLSVWREVSNQDRNRSGSVLEMLMGDSRRLFANHFVAKADVYLHRGVYPSFFDQAQREEEAHFTRGGTCLEPASNDHDHAHEAHESEKPRDWIEAFGRNFYPTEHRHLEGATEQREILPWLRLAAELNPDEPSIYPLTAYWLRQRMGKVDEAEEFLREGWRANPDSHEILFELGCLQEQDRHDPVRARNLFEAALRKWEQTQRGKEEPDEFGYMQITGHLARLEERAGNFEKALAYLELLRTVSPNPESIQRQIEHLQNQR